MTRICIPFPTLSTSVNHCLSPPHSHTHNIECLIFFSYSCSFSNISDLPLPLKAAAQQQKPGVMLQPNRGTSMMGMAQPNPVPYGQGFSQYGGVGLSPGQIGSTGYMNAGRVMGMGSSQRPQEPPQYHQMGIGYAPGAGGRPSSGVHMPQQPGYQG